MKEEGYNDVRFAYCSKEQGARFWDCTLKKGMDNNDLEYKDLKSINLENVLDMYMRGNSISRRVNARPLDNGKTSVSADFVKGTHCVIRYDPIAAEELGVVKARQLTCNVGIIESNEHTNVIDE